MEHSALQVRRKLILLPLLCVAACVRGQPIVLNPASIHLLPPPYVEHAALPTHVAAAPRPPCTGAAARRLTRARKDELFRQFASQDGQPDDAPTPAKAPTAACRTAGR